MKVGSILVLDIWIWMLANVFAQDTHKHTLTMGLIMSASQGYD